eukprot:TRINITY_DN7828_c0_g1_i3.p1 TRINITY_DN7828_c0_g1~~TRINITY_DN7828_c0_g1_i3.p1  ORF type:complete len:447 (+),score=95.65 TRINITY_DN7828_c0_g1_i3:1670-3010(+)
MAVSGSPAWELATTSRIAEAEVRKSLATRVRNETKQLRALLDSSAQLNQQSVNQQIVTKLRQTEFLCKELDRQLVATTGQRNELADRRANLQNLIEGELAGTAGVARGRAEQRSKRPAAEKVMDEVDQALDEELQLLSDSERDLWDAANRAEQLLDEIDSCRIAMNADLEDKRASLELDRKCLAVVPTAAALAASLPLMKRDELLDPTQGNEADRKWITDSLLLVQRGASLQQDAQHLGVAIESLMAQFRQRANDAASRTTAAFQTKVMQSTRLQLQLQTKLRAVAEEIRMTEEHIQETRNAIQATSEPLQVVTQRLALREKRPVREAIADSLAVLLQREFTALSTRMQQLRDTLQQLESQRRQLVETQEELRFDVHTKSIAQKLDSKCLEAPAEPLTTTLLNKIIFAPKSPRTLPMPTVRSPRRSPRTVAPQHRPSASPRFSSTV